MLRTRRRIAAQPPGWALSSDGLRSLRGRNIVDASSPGAEGAGEIAAAASAPEVATVGAGEGEASSADPNPFDVELAAIDAVLARSGDVLRRATVPARPAQDRNPMVYDLAWDEDERLEDWRNVLRQTDHLPPVLQAVVALDAWNGLSVLQHAPWLGRLFCASILRQAGVTTGAHLAAVNLGLKTIPVDRRRHRSREIRLIAIADGLIAAAEIGLKEHDRLALARKMMERKLQGRRASSKLPELVDLVMTTPLVHAGTVTRTLGVTPQAARRIVLELGLREMTGRGRFRAWGMIEHAEIHEKIGEYMSERTKRQHVVPRFYLRHFTPSDGELWTHDCVAGIARKSTPEKTAFETNIYTPIGEDGARVDLIEDTLAKIESQAASIYPQLLDCKPLDPVAKLDFAAFLATMFARSPAQLRQFAQTMAQMALWGGRHEMDRDFREKEKLGEVSVADKATVEIKFASSQKRI